MKDNRYRKLSSNRAITLIALIITIIVMLILVAVTVSVVVNSNLIGTAQKAGQDFRAEAEKESNMEKVTIDGKDYASIEDYQAGIAMVKAGEKATANMKYSDGTKTAVIPKGFTVSGIPSEQTIEGGLVIYLIPEGETVDWTSSTSVATAQKTYDQFVWIPVNNINDMYICQGKTASNGNCDIKVENGIAVCKNANHSTQTTPNKNTLMAGYLYTDDTMTARVTSYTEGTSIREPDTLPGGWDENSTHLGYLSSILEPDVETADKEYTSIDNFKEKLQEEYNEVVKSVYENKGFYVGRYETSGMAQSETSYDVAVVAGTLPSVLVDWYHMYAQQRQYAENNGLTVGSTMIQGAAYDQVMKFVNTASYSVTTAGNVAHDLDSRYNTGSQSTDQTKNIFDLEGNVHALTSEAGYEPSLAFFRAIRGGYYENSISASSRSYNTPGLNGYGHIGSMCQLYVK